MLSAQENEIFLMRFHEMEVSGNQSEFISANKNYFKPLASQAIKDKKWAGWQMLQSVTESNKYVFIHYYNSPKQYETSKDVFSSAVAEKLGLKYRDMLPFYLSEIYLKERIKKFFIT